MPIIIQLVTDTFIESVKKSNSMYDSYTHIICVYVKDTMGKIYGQIKFLTGVIALYVYIHLCFFHHIFLNTCTFVYANPIIKYLPIHTTFLCLFHF